MRRKPIDVTSVDEPETILAALLEHDRALWATAIYAGLRRGELRALRCDDIDLERGVIHVRRSWDDVEGEKATKTSAGERTVPILLPLAGVARHMLTLGRSGADLVFGSTAAAPFSTSSVDRRAKRAWAAAGIAPATLHTGRHATVSRSIAAGLDIKAVQTYAGHSSAVTTLDVYGHLFPGSIDTDWERLDEHLRAKLARKNRDSVPPDASRCVSIRMATRNTSRHAACGDVQCPPPSRRSCTATTVASNAILD